MNEWDRRLKPVAAKLVRPSIENVTLRRGTLEALATGLNRRLTLVCAPAGYGKTTTITAALQHHDIACVWYKLDVLDHDTAVFVTSLVEAFRHHIPAFGEVILERMLYPEDPPLALEQLCALLIAECEEHLQKDLHLVLDDYHEAAESPELNRALDYLLTNAPPRLRFIVLSRYDPAFPIGKMRLADQVTMLGVDLLCFDAPQAHSVLEARVGRPLCMDHVERLVELAEGWAASIMLAGIALDWLDPDSLDHALADPRMKQDVYSYLAEQVYRNEDPDTRLFLSRTSCLEHITVGLANDLLHIEDSHRYLNHLTANRVFTFATGHGAYRYHNLFREYLRYLYVHENGENAFRVLQRQTAEALERAGDIEMAVEHLLAANEPDAALGTIARAGEPGLEDFRTDSLSSWINRLPLEICRDHPWARLLSGQVLMRAGDFDAALLDIDAAARACTASDDRWGLYHALSAKECTLFWQGDVEGAVSTCDEALKYTSTDAQKLHTLLSMGSAALDRRDWTTAERAFDAAGELDRHASPGERTRAQALRASVAYYRGHFRQAVALSPQAISNDVSAAIASVVLNMSGLIHIAVGQYHSALVFLEQARQTEQKVGHSVTANMITDNIGLAMSGQGHLEEGLAEVTASAKLSQESGADSTLLACTLNHQASILRRMGREMDALDVCRQADNLVPLQRDPYLALNTRANLLFTESLLGHFCYDDLLDVAKNAEEAGLEFVRLKAHLYLALVAAASKPLYASQILQECVPQQLQLGHIHLLAQELVPRPSTALLALTSMPTEEDRKGLLDALAHHWRFADVVELLRDEDPELLIQTGLSAIDHADDTERADKAGGLPFDKDSRLGAPGQQPASLLAELTPRELDVLFLMTMGLRNPDIARTLYVSSATVKTHINHIFSKLAVTTRVQAILEYQMANMKPPTHLLGTSENQPTSL